MPDFNYDLAMVRSVANPVAITLSAVTQKISGNPSRLSIVFFALPSSSYRIYPGFPSAPATGGILVSANDGPVVIDALRYGNLVRNDFTIEGTIGDTILYAEALLAPKDRAAAMT